MLNEYSELGQTTVKRLLFRRQLTSAGFFERRYAKGMNPGNPLKALIANQQNIIKNMYFALLEKLKVMNPAFCFIYAYDLAS